MANEVIVKAGGEGGSIALYGLRSDASWQFSLDYIDDQPKMPEANDEAGAEPVVTSWSEALGLLDRYPWPRLTPMLVHPEFRAQLLDAVSERCASPGGAGSQLPSRWLEQCNAAVPDDLAKYQTTGPIHSSDSWLYDEVEEPTSEADREYLRKEMLDAGLTEDDIKDMF